MSKIWKRTLFCFSNEETDITYIPNEFINSVGSAAICGTKDCNRSTSKIRHLKKNDVTLEIRCQICNAEGKVGILFSQTERWLENDSTFKCPASECAAVNQTFQKFVEFSCCEENERQKRDFEKFETMRIRQEEYQKTYDAKEQTKKKIEEEKRAAKRAKEAIKEYEQKLKDAERNLKAYENEFRELHRQIDAKRRKLEEEVVVVGAMPPLLALKANHTEVAQKELPKKADQLAIKANPEDALQNIPKIEIPKHGRKILQASKKIKTEPTKSG